jgi:Rieske Fe-S protein
VNRSPFLPTDGGRPRASRGAAVPRGATRREFLGAAGSLALSLPVLTACGAPQDDGSLQGQVNAGSPDAIAVGDLQILPGTAACLGRDAGGIYAMTLICPHADCDMSSAGTVGPSGIYCACHGSQFDANGAVVRGPARRPLEHYAVTLDANGDLVVDGDRTVAASTRLVV